MVASSRVYPLASFKCFENFLRNPRLDLNQRPAAYETAALPLCYVGVPPQLQDQGKPIQFSTTIHGEIPLESACIRNGDCQVLSPPEVAGKAR